jgi:hypothetical protein
MNGYKTLLALALVFLTGCRRSPQINLFGSFFPAWMLCVALGVLGTLLLRWVFLREKIEPFLGRLPLVYFCLWVLLTLGCWLIFFRL